MWEMYPYHASSHEVQGVGGGQTVTINLKIGGGQDNTADVWTRTPDETANAFLVHQQMRFHQTKLTQMGLVPGNFTEVEALVPAAGVAPYYNHVTGFVNLYVKAAGHTGLGNWTNIPVTDYSLVSGCPAFCMTVRHEYSHAIHDYLLPILPPWGLSMPSEHSALEESKFAGVANQFLAYTEGWAEFLPLTTFGKPGQFEPNSPASGSLGLPVESQPGGHCTWEGAVAGLLWDIHDPAGQEEPIRRPPTKSSGGDPLPSQIQGAITWTDGLADANLSRIGKVVPRWDVAPVDPVDTIEEFLDHYKKLWPADLHALKAAAFNRDIVVSMPAEKPACIPVAPKVVRALQVVSIDFTVAEPDDEDRPFVKVHVWHAPGNGTPKLLTTEKLTTGWNGDQRPTSIKLNVPNPGGGGDALWLIVNDDMLPTAYRLANPPNIVQLANQGPAEWIGIDRLDPRLSHLQVIGQVLGAQGPSARPPRQPGRAPLDRVTPTGGENQGQAAAGLRDAIGKAEQELSGYAGRVELTRRTDRWLHHLARTSGQELDPGRLPDLHVRRDPAIRHPDPPVAVLEASRLPQYSAWTDQVASGNANVVALSAPARSRTGEHRGTLGDAVRAQEVCAGRTQQLANNLRRAFQAVDLGALTPDAREQTRQVVDGLTAALEKVGEDGTVVTRLRHQQSVFEALQGVATQREAVPARREQIPEGEARPRGRSGRVRRER
jgi:hypothetical protein